MLKKLSVAVLCASASLAIAEPQRAVLTTENKFPELRQLELGYDFYNREFEDSNYRSHELVARYGLIENLTARVHVPYDSNDPDFGDSESGLGDVRLGFDLVAYQDVFTYPYVIPHLDLSFTTGDEEKGLGSEDGMYMFGVAFGTVTHDMFHWILDLSYAANQGAKASDEDDAFQVGISFIWDVSERFTMGLEVLVQDFQDTDNEPYLIGGGLTYKWTESLQSRVFLGGWQEQESGEDQFFNFNTAYTF